LSRQDKESSHISLTFCPTLRISPFVSRDGTYAKDSQCCQNITITNIQTRVTQKFTLWACQHVNYSTLSFFLFSPFTKSNTPSTVLIITRQIRAKKPVFYFNFIQNYLNMSVLSNKFALTLLSMLLSKTWNCLTHVPFVFLFKYILSLNFPLFLRHTTLVFLPNTLAWNQDYHLHCEQHFSGLMSSGKKSSDKTQYLTINIIWKNNNDFHTPNYYYFNVYDWTFNESLVKVLPIYILLIVWWMPTDSHVHNMRKILLMISFDDLMIFPCVWGDSVQDMVEHWWYVY